MEEELKEKIKKLYQQLIEEEKGGYTAGYMCALPPNGLSYYNTAIELFRRARELCEINDKYRTYALSHTMEQEVEYVRDFQYKYDKNAKKPKVSSINELTNLMKDATSHIYRDFVAFLH